MRRRVILLVEMGAAYGRGCLCGIARYARSHGGWTLLHRARQIGEPLDLDKLREWRPDGVIARTENPQVAHIVEALRVPSVALSDDISAPTDAAVGTDARAVVKMAVDYLLECGFEHLAFCGYPGLAFSIKRQETFRRLVRSRRLDAHVYQLPAGAHMTSPAIDEQHFAQDEQSLQDWLDELPKPVGIVACNDTRGRQILEACINRGIRVPAAVAVVGIDNDQVICELSSPTLTSVIPNVDTVGYEAARLLERLMNGEPVEEETLLIPPVGIESRESSNVSVFRYPELARATQYIRDHAHEGINVNDVIKHCGASRSKLERHFSDQLGCTPHEFVVRCRINRVKQLLIETNFTLTRIAAMTGFQTSSHMAAVFRKHTGKSPGQYRSSF